MHHDLKTVPKQFKPVLDGKMKSIIRENDRDYQINDTVTLNEGWQGLNGFEHTCESISARISYIDDFGCQHGYVNLSLDDVGMLIVK